MEQIAFTKNMIRASLCIAVVRKIFALVCGAYEGGTSAELATTQAWITVFVALVTTGGSALLLRWLLPRLQDMSEDNQLFVALLIKKTCDHFVKMESVIPLLILSAVAITTIGILTTTLDIDKSGFTEGLLLGFSKMCWFFMFESKIWQSAICGIVLVSVIALRKGDTIMLQIVLTINFFRVTLFVAVLGAILALIWCGAYEDGTSARIMIMQAWKIVLIALAAVGGSTLYVKLLRWLLPRLQNRRTLDLCFVELLVQSMCDPFVGTESIMPLAVISVIAMMTISILITTVDEDSTGVTDGLFLGFGTMFLGFMIKSKIRQSAICGVVLICTLL